MNFLKTKDGLILKRWNSYIHNRTFRYFLLGFVGLLLVSCFGALLSIHLNQLYDVAAMSYHVQPTPSGQGSAQKDSSGASSSRGASSVLPRAGSASGSGRTSSAQKQGPVSSGKPPEQELPAALPAYQSMYPNLFVKPAAKKAAPDGKVVYLTFDDGPSNLTMPLLNVLDRYHVKATFFVVGKTGKKDLAAMKAIVARGNAIGVHSYTHKMNQIYVSPAAFLQDFAKMHDLIQKTTGVDTHIYRFAGGSVNSFNKRTAKAILAEMNRRGYTYFDWNVSSDDALAHSTASSIYSKVIREVHQHPHSVVLMHNTNTKKATLSEVPHIIETLLKEGYRFETLGDMVDNTPYIFRLPN